MSTDPVQALLDAGAISTTSFSPSSRYQGVALGCFQPDHGSPAITYVLRRFIPQGKDIATQAEHLVTSGERPDLLGSQYLGDPELYWRIADANVVTDPFELTDTVGLRVRLPAPSGQ